MQNIILASASPRRAELLKQIGIHFSVFPADIQESISGEINTEVLVQSLSYEKAFHVAKSVRDDAIVIGADTLVVKDEVLGKPQDEKQAFEMLSSLQGGWHEVITGITIIKASSLLHISDFEKTRVKMKPLTGNEIRAYIRTGEPMDKAGAYGIQGIGAIFIEKIEGCYFNVVGLPIMKLSGLLKEFGITILQA